MKRFVLRTIKVGGCLLSLAVLATVTAVWLACQEPAFYADVGDAGAIASAEQEALQRKQQDFQRWATAAPIRGEQLEVDAASTHSVQFTQPELNQLLAAERVGSAGAPRVEILDGSLKAGVEIKVGGREFVVSAKLKPTIQPSGKLQLEIVGSKLGKLPLPTHRLLSFLSRHATLSSSKARLSLDGEKPIIELDLSGRSPRAVAIASVSCEAKAITIVFTARGNQKVVQQPAGARR